MRWIGNGVTLRGERTIRPQPGMMYGGAISDRLSIKRWGDLQTLLWEEVDRQRGYTERGTYNKATARHDIGGYNK